MTEEKILMKSEIEIRELARHTQKIYDEGKHMAQLDGMPTT